MIAMINLFRQEGERRAEQQLSVRSRWRAWTGRRPAALAAVFGTTLANLTEDDLDPLALRLENARAAVVTAEAAVRASAMAAEVARGELERARDRVTALEAAERLRSERTPAALGLAVARLRGLVDHWADVLAEAGLDHGAITEARKAAEDLDGVEWVHAFVERVTELGEVTDGQRDETA
ncbi:MAG: hypothetical protein ABS81_03250 [Pseudonocardia sp. SCN 72-86]|nr:MAG: hypothetical protein ABS81_03250 [Pseudonocardia sp. SCN 72-86]